jgi:hypothetical protein
MIDRFIRIRSKIYHNTPGPLRFVFWPAVKVLSLNYLLRPQQWIMNGKESSSSQELRLIFTGTEQNKNYLAGLAFKGSYTVGYAGRKWLWQKPASSSENKEAFIAVNEIPKSFYRFLKNSGRFFIPSWVSGEIDISGDLGSFIRQRDSLHSDFRKVKKYGLESLVVTDLKSYNEFYYRMYVPYILKRFDNAAFVLDYNFTKKLYHKCELIFVKKGEELIGGNVVLFEKQVARPILVGVKDGNWDLVKEGAVGASYFFSLSRAKEKGYTRVNLGGSRPFLKDGVLNYKRQWALKLSSEFQTGFLLNISSMSEGIKGFLMNNPFIYLDKSGLNGAAFIDRSPSEAEYLSIARKHWFKGMKDIFVFQCTSNGQLVSFRLTSRIMDQYLGNPGGLPQEKVSVETVQT